MYIDPVQTTTLRTTFIDSQDDVSSTAYNRQTVSRAVQVLNSAADPATGRELSISIDPQTQQPIVRVVDPTSGEVIGQVPLEYVLRIADLLASEKEQADAVRIS